MASKRLRDRLLISAVIISIAVALASMLAVSMLIRQQHLAQSNAVLAKAARVVGDNLGDRQNSQLSTSRQLATQKNLGSTLWYLSQYAQAGVDRETLANTYLQLVRDIRKIGRVANLARVAIYDLNGNLVAFASFNANNELIGYVERAAKPLFMQATLKNGEELSRQTLQASESVEDISARFSGPLPQQESAYLAVNKQKLVIESQVPIMGVAFDPASGKQEIKQLGLVAAMQILDEAFIDNLSRLTDVNINLFTAQGFSSGNLAAYRTPDWGSAADAQPSPKLTFNETSIDGVGYYQCLTPLYTNKRFVGSFAVLQSKAVVDKNTWQMIGILGLIALACLLIISPLSWYFSTTISHPLTVLSRIFRSIANGEQNEALGPELSQLESGAQWHAELKDLTESFFAMERAINLKMQQINEINATLEHTVAQRTAELRIANEELTNLVTHDALTGLPNRKLLADRLQQALAAARRNGSLLALMYLDLDEFKPVNDELGHDVGDLLLQEVARRIVACMRESDTVARIGGDEFIVLLPVVQSPADGLAAAEKIRLALNQPFDLAGRVRHISTSIGIAIFPGHGSDEAALFKNADAAMYLAKNSGRNNIQLFSAEAQSLGAEHS
jgi:diguanylate cyclase (GGDEF)-like protein